MLRDIPLFAVLILPAFSAAQTSGSGPTTIQVTSRIVYVDVIVRDNTGKVVHGLSKDDFRVSEDGKPQTIDYFSEHFYDPAAVSSEPASPLTFTNGSERGQPSTATILLFDLLNTSTANQLVAREQMLKFLQSLPPGRRVSLFTLTDKLQMIQSFTRSPELLTAAEKMLNPVAPQHMPSREQVQRDQDTAGEFNRESSPKGRSPSGSTAMADNVQTQDTDLDLRTYSTIAALTQLAQMVGSYQGRKNLFWVSESFPVALNTTTNFLGQKLPVDAMRMSNLLSSTRIAVYPVSVLGMDNGTSLVAYRPRPDPKFQYFERGNLKSAMNATADQTGGQAIVGTNDLGGAMRRDLDDSANYYTLAYQPQNKKWNRQFRSIHVELARTGDSLAYRRGYFAFPEDASPRNAVQELYTALQSEMPESSALTLLSKIELPSTQHPSVLVHATLGAASLDLAVGPDGHHRGQLLVMLVASNGDSRMSDSSKAKSSSDAPPQPPGVLNLDFDAAQYQAVLKSGIAFTQQLSLPPGRYRLRLGVCDVVSHRLGTLDMPIAVPAQTVKN